MSQNELLVTLAKNVPCKTLIAGAVKNISSPSERRENLEALLDAHIQANANAPVVSAKEFVDFVYQESSAPGMTEEIAAQIISVVCDAFREMSISPDDLSESGWKNALWSAISQDDVATVMALDTAGLIDRHTKGAGGATQNLWSHAINVKSRRCNQYLLSTTSQSDLGGFPPRYDGGGDLYWPANLEMATDCIASIEPAEFSDALANIDEQARYHSSANSLRRAALCSVVAALERGSYDSATRESDIYQRLLGAVIDETVAAVHRELREPEMAMALLTVLDRCSRLDSDAAFRYAQQVIGSDGEGKLLAPQYLMDLIGRGLPVQREFKNDEGPYVVHLMSGAKRHHFDVLDEFVTDKEAFMRDFGPSFVGANVARSVEGCLGVENKTLMLAAERGYPFGRISVPSKHGTSEKAVYERIYGAVGKVDAFIIGHVTGQLGPDDRLEAVGPVHVAVGRKLPSTIVALARKGHSIEEPCPESYSDDVGCYGCAEMTPLVIALKQGDSSVVQTLLELGADTAVKAPTGATTMQLARTEGLKQMIRSARTAKVVDDTLNVANPTDTRSKKSTRFDAL